MIQLTRLSTLLLGLGIVFHANAQQNRLTLHEVQQMSREHYPLLKQQAYYKELQANKWHETGMMNMPQLSVTGQATYQSEVTKFNIPGSGASGFQQKPDQYALGLELKKTINDWGVNRKQQEMESMQSDMQQTQVDIDLLKLKERVNGLFGNLLYLQENEQILNLRISDLEARGKKVKAAVDQGAALKSSYLIIESDKLSTQQKLEEIRFNRVLGCQLLSLYTQQNIDTTFQLARPELVSVDNNAPVRRPENTLFSLQKNQLQTREKFIQAIALPKVFVFGRGYYGRPGFNFLNNEFRPYGLVGIGLNWNLSAYYTLSKEKQDVALNQKIVEAKQAEFELNLKSDLWQKSMEVQKLERLINMDADIVRTKTEIKRSAASQLDNGVITPSDYLTELNAETQARLNKTLHEIQWLMAIENYATALGQ
ncbi:MAG: TolC family protein [Chitinophagaceae bacterium]